MSVHRAPADAALRNWQQALLSALWAPTHDAALKLVSSDLGTTRLQWRGIAAYRSHAAAQAVRSLQAACPVVAELLGAEDFEALARLLWRAHPPLCGDLALWGGALAAQIEALPELLADQPFLADVARVEWVLHSVASLADAVPDPASFARLAHEDPALLYLELAPGAVGLASPWPVVTLIEAQGQARQLVVGAAETALVWRNGWRPMLRRAQPGEPEFLQALQAGRSLGDALAGVPSFDFAAWLAPAVHEGLLLRVVSHESAKCKLNPSPGAPHHA